VDSSSEFVEMLIQACLEWDDRHLLAAPRRWWGSATPFGVSDPHLILIPQWRATAPLGANGMKTLRVLPGHPAPVPHLASPSLGLSNKRKPVSGGGECVMCKARESGWPAAPTRQL
jgi:hypothetical protein